MTYNRFILFLFGIGTIIFCVNLYLENSNSSELRWVDGDTFHYRDSKFRLLNCNAPETTYRAECDRELILGDRATKMARFLTENVRDVRVEDTGMKGYYGRKLGVVYVNDKRICDYLIENELATERNKKEDWCNNE